MTSNSVTPLGEHWTLKSWLGLDSLDKTSLHKTNLMVKQKEENGVFYSCRRHTDILGF